MQTVYKVQFPLDEFTRAHTHRCIDFLQIATLCRLSVQSPGVMQKLRASLSPKADIADGLSGEHSASEDAQGKLGAGSQHRRESPGGKRGGGRGSSSLTIL